jgi:hypothetical protein
MSVIDEKSTFLCAYDYGMGGLWRFVRASSAQAITQRYPELQVMESRPSWMSETDEARIRSQGVLDLDDDTGGIFEVVVAERAKRGH